MGCKLGGGARAEMQISAKSRTLMFSTCLKKSKMLLLVSPTAFQVNLSQNVLGAGFNIAALQLLWRKVNFHNKSQINQKCWLIRQDPYWPGKDRDPITWEKKDGHC